MPGIRTPTIHTMRRASNGVTNMTNAPFSVTIHRNLWNFSSQWSSALCYLTAAGKNQSYEFKKVAAEIFAYNSYAVASLNPTGK